jgi:glycosyltransferase involved in cell wall biosynthesis
VLGTGRRVTSIGLDLSFLAPGATGGMETYARALVPRLAQERPDVRWVAFCGRELAAELRREPWVPDLEVVELPVSSRTRVRRTAVEQTLLPRLIRRAVLDLVHSFGNTAPLAPGGPPLVLTVHDVIWARMPETHRGLLAKGLAFIVPRAARRAGAIIADSHSTAGDVNRFLGIPADRIHVVACGPGLDHTTSTPETELRTRLALGDEPLILYPAPRRPHKNVPRLVGATAGLDATVVVPGYAAVQEREVESARHVRYLGWVSDADMEGLYRSATLLAFPSLAEGFGLPVLEAMRRGLPVACADATSLPEITGDAALLFDPLDEEAIRAAVARLLDDPALRAELARRGRIQAARFSWDAAATNTWRVYDRVIGARGMGSPQQPGLLRRIAGRHPPSTGDRAGVACADGPACRRLCAPEAPPP